MMRLDGWTTLVASVALSIADAAFGNMYIANDNTNCTLASPPLIFEASQIKVNITKQLLINESEIKEDVILRIGYNRVYKMFEYIGCLNVSNLTKIELHEEEVGFCYSACEYKLFGIIGHNNSKGMSCYCLGNHTKPADKCKRKCKFDLPCGGSGIYASVYKFTDVNVSLVSQNVNFNVCSTYTSTTKSWKWSPCNASYDISTYVCTGENNSIAYNNSFHWASLSCFKKEQSLVSWENVSNVENHTEMWLANIRSTSIQVQEGNSDQKLFMFVKNGSYFLNITASTNDYGRKLCVDKTSMTASTSSTNENPDNHKTSTETSMTASTSSTNENPDNHKTSTVAVAVSVTSVVVVAMGAVGGYIAWKRRTRTVQAKKKNQYTKPIDQRTEFTSKAKESSEIVYSEEYQYSTVVRPHCEPTEGLNDNTDVTIYDTTAVYKNKLNKAESNNVYDNLNLNIVHSADTTNSLKKDTINEQHSKSVGVIC